MIKVVGEVNNLDEVANEILNFEPVYLPQGLSNPFKPGELMTAEHRSVFRVPTSLYDASMVEAREESGKVKKVFDLKTARGLMAANYDNCQATMTKLGEVGPEYQPLLNRDLIKTVRPVIESEFISAIGAGSINGGQKVFIQGRLFESEPVKGNVRHKHILFANAHDSSIAPSVAFTEIVVSCQNRLRLALSKAADKEVTKKLSIRHSSQVVKNFETLVELINLVTGEFMTYDERLKDLAKITIQDEAELRKIIRVIYGNIGRKGRTEDRIVEAFETCPGNELPGIKGTGLALHEAFTYFLTHKAGNVNTTSDTRVDNAYFLTANTKFMEKVDHAILTK